MKATVKMAAIIAAGGLLIIGNKPAKVNAQENNYDTSSVAGVSVSIDSYLASSASSDVSTEGNDVTPTKAAEEETAKYPDFAGICMANVDAYLNVRLEPNTDCDIVGRMYPQSISTVVEKGDEWTKIQSGNVEGYVKNEFLVFDDEAGEYAESVCPKVATVNTQTLNVREEATTDSEIVTQIATQDEYLVLSATEDNNWYNIQVDDETTGFVSKDYVIVRIDTINAKTTEEIAAEEAAKAEEEAKANEAAASSNSSSSKSSSSSSYSLSDGVTYSGSGSDIANYACQFVGNPYVFGESSLTNGTDCSGFTMSVYAQFGIGLDHSSVAQSKKGAVVSMDSLQPGDLLFYNNGGSVIGHVAIYIGGGQVVHAADPNNGICITSMYWSGTPCAARRIVQ